MQQALISLTSRRLAGEDIDVLINEGQLGTLEDVGVNQKALPSARQLRFLVLVAAGAQVYSPAGLRGTGLCGGSNTVRGHG